MDTMHVESGLNIESASNGQTTKSKEGQLIRGTVAAVWRKGWSALVQSLKYGYFSLLVFAAIVSTLQLMTVFDLHKELAAKFFVNPSDKSTIQSNGGSGNPTDTKEPVGKPDWNENIQQVRLAAMLLRQEEILTQNKKELIGSNINNTNDNKIKNVEGDLKQIESQIKENIDSRLILYIKALSGYNLDDTNFLIRVPPIYIGMPIIMLTLLISLWMGVLGSTIRMIFDLLTTKNRFPFHWYVFQPLQGALLAFAVFILFKAGHLALSGGGATGIGGELNPYIIAFLGIVSGMLSEKAYRRIGLEGARLLADDTLPRYVRPDVALQQLRERRKSLEDLATFFNEGTDVREWLRGNEKLPSDAQTIVSAWLNAPKWQLLSDLPPKPITDADLDAAVNKNEPDEEAQDQQREGHSTGSNVPPAPSSVAGVTQGVTQKVEAGIKALTELAPLFPPGKFNTLLTEANAKLQSTATGSEGQQQASLQENAPPILVATTFIKELSAVGSVVGLAFPPAALGLALANLAASLTETNYRRWYAGVMNEQYSPVKFAPEALDPSAAHTLVNRCSSWKDRMAGLMGDRDKVCAIVKAALAADMGEALWADAGFGVSTLFGGDHSAFEAAVDELRAEAKKIGVDEALSQAPAAEGSGTGGNVAVMAEVEKIRRSDGARDAEAALDFLITSLNWFKVNGPGLDQIIGQFRALGGH